MTKLISSKFQISSFDAQKEGNKLKLTIFTLREIYIIILTNTSQLIAFGEGTINSISLNKIVWLK